MEFKNTLAAGTMLRQYRVEKVIGQGGFGITYLAFDTELQRQVAIKECYPRDFVMREGTTVVSSSPNSDTDYNWALGKFMDEATTLAKFRHPGIVQVLQILKEENNTAYMVLEFVRGQSLDQWLKALPGRPSQAQLSAILAPILDALEAVHRENIAHRDIAPDNIYIRPNGDALLLDFGAAKLTLGQHSKTLNLVVKDGYSAPEQYYAEGRQGPWTDIYALAATLYRCIAGKRPVDAMARLDATNNGEPDPLIPLESLNPEGYSPGFLQAVAKGLAPQTKARPQSIGEWRKDLGGAVQGERIEKAPATQVIEPPAARSKPRQVSSKKSPLPALAIAAALVMVAAAAGFWLYDRHITQLETEEWQRTANADNTTSYNAFIAAYPNSIHVDEANAALSALTSPWTATPGKRATGEITSIALQNGAILAAGYEETQGTLGRQGVIYRLSHSGKTINQMTFGEAGAETFRAVIPVENGGVVAVGDTISSSDQHPDATIVRFSSTGEIAWSRRFTGPGSGQLFAVRQLASGNLLAAGTTSKNVFSSPRGWLLQLSPKGDLVQELTFDGTHNEGGTFTSVTETNGGGIVLAGYTGKQDSPDSKFWIVRLSSDGSLLLDRDPGGAGLDRINAAASGSNGEIILAGETTSFGTRTNDGIILRLTADNKIPPKVFAKDKQDSFSAVTTDASGSVYVAGSSNSESRQLANWVMKLSPDLRDTIWEEHLTHEGDSKTSGLAILPDGSLLVSGSVKADDGSRRGFIQRIFPEQDEAAS